MKSAAWQREAGEGWEWRSDVPQKRFSLRPTAGMLTLVAISWFAWPAGAARRMDDLVGPSASHSLLGWTRSASPQAPAPRRTLVDMAQKETGADVVVPPVKRQQPKPPPAAPAAAETPVTQPAAPAATSEVAAPQAASPSTGPSTGWPGFSSVLAPITEWLAKANREYQGTIVKELSKPSPEQMQAEANRLAQEQAAREREAAALAEAAKTAAAEEAKKLAEAEAARKAAALKEADAKKQAAAAAPPPAVKTEPVKPETPKVDGAAQQAEAARQAETARKAAEAEAELRRKLEAQRLADERRLEQLKQQQARKEQAEAERAAREAKQAESRAAARPVGQPSPSQAASAHLQHRRWTVTIIPEPIDRPAAISAVRHADAGGVLLGAGRMSLGASGVKGTAVKRWIWREGACRLAGRKTTRQERYTVARGDSLWRISTKYYEEGAKYPRIYKANRDRIADPDLIYPCQKFRVPKR